MGLTPIEWTATRNADGSVTKGRTWNPLKARTRAEMMIPKANGAFRIVPAGKVGYHCERISQGCGHCYACTMNGRTLPAWGTGLDYTVPNRAKVEIFIDEKVLLEPLLWKKPTKIFPGSMTDWAAEFVTDEMMDRMLAVAALCPQHTFQFLTKRAGRLERHFSPSAIRDFHVAKIAKGLHTKVVPFKLPSEGVFDGQRVARGEPWRIIRWPLPNVQLGFSAEDQPNFDERWHEMRKLAEAGWFVWVSLEPMLGPINVRGALLEGKDPGQCANCGEGHGFSRCPNYGSIAPNRTHNGVRHCSDFKRKHFALGWGVAGGESGPGARPMDLQWVRDLIKQFKAARVPLFFKQAGANPYVMESDLPKRTLAWPYSKQFPMNGRIYTKLADKKGGDLSELPCDVCCREFPEVGQ